MTLRIPRWVLGLLAAVLVVAVVAAAFVVGRSSSGSDSAAVATAEDPPPEADEPATPPSCDEDAAQEAVFEGEFRSRSSALAEAHAAIDGTKVTPEEPTSQEEYFDPIYGFTIAVLECEDLTGDEREEMVVALGGGAAGRIFQWAIFTAPEGSWQLALLRPGRQITALRIKEGNVVERAPVYEQGDPSCCPSGNRTTEITFDGEAFVSASAQGSDRSIEIRDGALAAFGDINPQTDSPVQAVESFASPTGVDDTDGEICVMDWSDLGLTINFVNLGGLDPCGPDGRIGSIHLVGPLAEQAGWATTNGVGIGTTTDELRSLYPRAVKSGKTMTLVERPSPYGDAGVTPSLTAYVVDSETQALVFAVGAGGD